MGVKTLPVVLKTAPPCGSEDCSSLVSEQSQLTLQAQLLAALLRELTFLLTLGRRNTRQPWGQWDWVGTMAQQSGAAFVLFYFVWLFFSFISLVGWFYGCYCFTVSTQLS